MKRVFAIRGKNGRAESIKKVLGLFGCNTSNFYYGFEKVDVEDEAFCFSSKGACRIENAEEKGLDVFDIDFIMERFGVVIERIPYEIGGAGIEGTIWTGKIIGFRYIEGKVKPLADVRRMEYCEFTNGDLTDYIDFFIRGNQ